VRLVIFGTGAIGGVLAAALVDSGADVVAIARGRQLEALRRGDLQLHTPRDTITARVPVVASPADVQFGDDDVVLLTVKSQNTHDAISSLAAAAGPRIPVVAVQNGVANERALARVFRHVYGSIVMMPATFVEAGQVSVYGDPKHGAIDLGRFPSGTDEVAARVAAALQAANFDSRVVADIMRWKYGKLVGNLGNAIEALCGLGTRGGELGRLLRSEGEAVLAAAGIDWVRDAEEDERRAGNVELDEAGGIARQGASSWQSLRRNSGSIETDYLNGEIALLGRLHGVPTPANDLIQEIANDLARSNGEPGSVPEAHILERLALA
jgi:2-dehydropantoate 2-reductase